MHNNLISGVGIDRFIKMYFGQFLLKENTHNSKLGSTSFPALVSPLIR